MLRCVLTSAAAAALSSACMAGMMPPMGGPMQMFMISVDNDMQSVMAMPMGDFGPVQLQNYGDTYSGDASVLNGTWFNRQWGWAPGGFINLGDNSLWIERVSSTPGLSVYMGGSGMELGSMDPIFGTDGSSDRIQWDGMMLHNWFAGTTPGTYEYSFRIYVGDSQGNDLGWQSATTRFTFELVPAPGALALIVAAGLARNRRRHA